MQNPFEELDNEKLLPHFNNYENKPKKYTYLKIVIIVFIYLLEIFTAVLGGLNNQEVNTFPNTNFTIQYWLLASGLYNIIGLMCTYQFPKKNVEANFLRSELYIDNSRPLFKYNNKLYFVIYDIIKLLWLAVGSFILLNYNSIIHCNFIIGYTLFYLILDFVYLNYTFQKTIKLRDIHI
jgi:hypothetical protein